MRKFITCRRLFTISSVLLTCSIILVTIVISCRKISQQAEEAKANELAIKFFTGHRSSDPVITAAENFVKQQNEKYNFLNSLTKRIGFPYWDESMFFSRLYAGRGSWADSESVIYIPFVRDTENFVNAALIIKMNVSDTTFRFLYDWQYAGLGFDTITSADHWTARDVFHVFAVFDKTIFGGSKFLITDGRIFNRDTEQYVVTLVDSMPNTAGRGNLYEEQTICNIIEECGLCAFRGETINPGRCCSPTYTIQCTSIWVYVDDPSNGTGGGTGGGGGGSGDPGGGWQDPCSGGGGALPRGEVVQPCDGSGWQPIPPDNGLLPDESIDTVLNKYAQFVNKYRDSLGALCESEHKERFFNIVNYNNQLDTFRVLIGLSDDEVKPNYYMTGGRILYGSWHYHPKYSDGTPGSWPSGGDVTQLYDKPAGFIMIIDTYDARYALTVEDVTKMTVWKNIFGNGPTQLPFRLAQAVYADPRAYSTGSDYVQMTKEKLLAALGSSANCGIGLYQAISANGTTFTKIN
ncbi:MAG TPA: hypothetical protein VHD35_00020 [Chitinophagaceae bacterium]|jgi:hypothetical protein|nr:hypothetical protein [Chitinophagaceae bacterium]